MQLASLEVVTQSSSFTGLPQYVSFMPGLATCTLPSPLVWRMFTCGRTFCLMIAILPRLARPGTEMPRAFLSGACSVLRWL